MSQRPAAKEAREAEEYENRVLEEPVLDAREQPTIDTPEQAAEMSVKTRDIGEAAQDTPGSQEATTEKGNQEPGRPENFSYN
jgi:hypothetical protein